MVPPTTAAPPTISPPLPCDEETQDDGWIKPSGGGQFCYKFALTAGDDETWQTAEYSCLMEVSKLKLPYI